MSCRSKASAAERSLQAEQDINLQEYATEWDAKKWPDRHESKFNDIHKILRRVDFEAWKAEIEKDDDKFRGNRELRNRVKEIAARVERLRKSDANESDWRQYIEPLVFKRFDTDVCCGTPNIDKLFDVKSEYYVKVNGKNAQKPDKLVGLRSAGDLWKTLRAGDKRDEEAGKTLWQTLQPSLVIEDREPVMYPFLVAEAKAENAPGSFRDNYDQMSTIIKKSLEIQMRLYDALKPGNAWEDGPLVWVLANRGSAWEVSAAYPRRVDGEACSDTRHPCLVLWRGDIRSHDEALQLLLVMDYIYEWARGYHRTSVIKGLKSLAAEPIRDDVSDLPSIAKHTVYTRHGLEDDEDRRPHIRPGIPVEQDPGHVEEASSITVADSAFAVLRDASRVRSQFLGILVTQDSLEHLSLNDGLSFLNQINTIVYNVAHGHQGQFLYLKRCHLNRIEDEWTGYLRMLPGEKEAQETFLVLLTFTAFTAADWHLTRELSVISISVAMLRKRLDRDLRVRLRLDERITPTITPVMQLVEAFLEAPSHAILDACIHGTPLTPSKRMWEAMQEGSFIERSNIHPGGLLEVSKSPWRDLASQLRTARREIEAMNDSVLESSQERGARVPPSRSPEAYPWMEHPVIPSTSEEAVVVFSPPADPLQEEITSAEAAMYCMYCFQTFQIRGVMDNLRFGRTRVETFWSTERMTKQNEKKLRWNNLRYSQSSSTPTLENAQGHVAFLVDQMMEK